MHYTIIFKTVQSIVTSGFDFTLTPLLILSSVAFFLVSNFIPLICFDFWPEVFVNLCNGLHSVHGLAHPEVIKDEEHKGDAGKKVKENDKKNWDTEEEVKEDVDEGQ